MVGHLAAPLVAFAVTVSLAPLVIRALLRWQVLDEPGGRSSHTVATPRGGGLAILAGLLAGAAVAPRSQAVAAVAVATLAFGAVGALEDFRGVPPLSRFGLQLVAAVASVAVWSPSRLGAVVAACLVVAYANAFNFMDGVNGISVAQVVVAALAYAGLAARADDRPLAICALVLVAGALGFLPWNFPRASVFLGDAGSYALGAALALLALALLRAGQPPEAVAAPLLVYVADTATTLLRRVHRGEAWYLPHRTHVYQRLTDLGWSHVRVTAFVALVIAACSVLGAVSLTGSMPPRIAADAGIAAVLAGYLRSPAAFREAH